MAAVDDVFRVAARMQGPQGQDIINVWHAVINVYNGGGDADVAQELVDEISSHYQDLEPGITVDQASADMSVQNLTTEAVLGTFSWNPAFLGTLAGDTLPPQTSLFGIFRTGIARRIGRKFLGIVPEAGQDAGIIGSAVLTALTTFMANWIGGFVGPTTNNGYLWGVYNENISPSFKAFIEAVAKSRLKTQRRRLPGIGS